MGYEPELQARRLQGRWDPVHLAAARAKRATARPVDLEDLAALTDADGGAASN